MWSEAGNEGRIDTLKSNIKGVEKSVDEIWATIEDMKASVPTVPLCLLFYCPHCSSVPTVLLSQLFLCAYCSTVPTVPLCALIAMYND